MSSNAVVPVTPPSPVAPIYSGRYFKRNSFCRIPPPADRLGLHNGKPYWIPIFDSATLLANGTLPALGSAENNYQLTTNFAWLATLATTNALQSVMAINNFAFQLLRTYVDAEGNQQSRVYQKTPIWNQLGSGGSANAGGVTKTIGVMPLYLRKPVLVPEGSEILCRVQSLFAPVQGAQAIQIVLFGYIEG